MVSEYKFTSDIDLTVVLFLLPRYRPGRLSLRFYRPKNGPKEKEKAYRSDHVHTHHTHPSRNARRERIAQRRGKSEKQVSKKPRGCVLRELMRAMVSITHNSKKLKTCLIPFPPISAGLNKLSLVISAVFFFFFFFKIVLS